MAESIDIKDLELNALLEITQAINNNLSEDDLYRIYKFTLLGDLKVSRMALFVKDAGWRCKVSFGTAQSWENRVMSPGFENSKDIVVLDDNSEYSEFDKGIPVLHKDRMLAMVFVGGLSGAGAVDSSTFLHALTNIMIVAIENKKLARRELEREAYRKEMEIAKKVQNFLFPGFLPSTEKLQVEAVYQPHNEVGGDYYDYIQIDENRFLICVADVSGKGVPAALLMSNFQAALRTLSRQTLDLKDIVSELNHLILQSGNGENFITFYVAIYDFNTCTLEYVNCGHNPQYLIENGKIRELNDGTTILGMFEPLPFLQTVKIEGLKSFQFFGYSDGLTETFNEAGEQFGEERLCELLEGNINTDLKTLHQQILTELQTFKDKQPYRDDITILSCRVMS